MTRTARKAPGRKVTWEDRPSGNVRLRWRFDGKPQSITFAAAEDAERVVRNVERLHCNVPATDPDVQAAYRADLRAARSVASGRTLRTVAEQYVQERLSPKPQSQKRYASILRGPLAPFLDRPINAITAQEINDWTRKTQRAHAASQAAGARRKDGAYADNSIRAALDLLCPVLTWAQQQGLRSDSPTGDVRRPEPVMSAGDTMTRAQYDALIAAASDPIGQRWHQADLYQLLVFSGLRIGEALALQAGDFDAANAVVHVRRSMVEGSAHLEPSKGKTRNAAREVDLTAGLVDLLRRRTAGLHSTDYVFHREDGSMQPRNGVMRRFNATCKRAGLGHYRLHDLRHTCATWLLSDPEVAPLAVSQHLGHGDLVITTKIYGHRTARARAALVGSLEALEPAAAPTPLRRRKAG